MATYVKRFVSRNRNRYTEDGFDLDLTYIRRNIIAMGFPAEKTEGLYRNHIQDVIRMLGRNHFIHYKVYNLCSERSYDPARFHQRVATYPFDEHNVPPFELISHFCADMNMWLNEDSRNVAVVHCKTGKGRTGVMICSYLLHTHWSDSVYEVLDFYASTRTRNRKGITIPSQRRYVQYYGHLMKNSLQYCPKTVWLKAIKLEGIPNFSGFFACAPSFVIKKYKTVIFTSKVYENIRRSDALAMLTLSKPIPLYGDIKIEFFHNQRIGRKLEKMFRFWFNTFFTDWHLMQQQQQVSEEMEQESASESDEYKQLEEPLVTRTSTVSPGTISSSVDCTPLVDDTTGSPNKVLVFTKQELDKASKDRKHKHFPPYFKVHLIISEVNTPDTHMGCDTTHDEEPHREIIKEKEENPSITETEWKHLVPATDTCYHSHTCSDL